MAIVEMKKMTLIALMSERAQIINALYEFGVLHMIDMTEHHTEETGAYLEKLPPEGRVKVLEEDLNHVRYLMEGLKRFSSDKKKLTFKKTLMNPLKYHEILTGHERLQEIYKQFTDLEAKQSAINIKETANLNLIGVLTPWKTLEEPLEN